MRGCVGVFLFGFFRFTYTVYYIIPQDVISAVFF